MEWLIVKSVRLLLVVMCLGLSPSLVAEPSTDASIVYKDSDADGIPDYLDACPDKVNIGRSDRDGDMLLDNCDIDPAGDGRIRPIGQRWVKNRI